MKEILLTQGKVALVDDDDFEYLNQWKWHARKSANTFYASRNKMVNGRYVPAQMHREIVDPGINMQVDHKDRNGLNNQKSNLRVCTISQNCANVWSKNNTSGYRGVHWHKPLRKWLAQISFENKKLYIGVFDSVIDAAKAYDKKACELFGEFASLNFPNQEER